MKRQTLILAIFILAIVFLPTKLTMADTVTNKYCPVLPAEPVDENIFTDYEGQRVYFCCKGCRRDFLADPEVYLANLASEDSPQHSVDPTHHDSSLDHEKGMEHDHATDHDGDSKVITFLGKFHPMVTHFPIALVFMALILTGLAMVMNKVRYEEVAVTLICWAAGFAIITVLLGLAAGSGASYPSILENYFSWHRILGLATGFATLLAAAAGLRWRRVESREWQLGFRLLLVINAILIGITSHFGAILVFGPNHFSI